MEKRVRSPNYPALSLPEAIEKVTGVYRNMHNHAGPREVVAKAMGYTGLNGASATSISALHKFGLLEKAGEDIKVSERALRILHPHSVAERAEAIRDAAFDPPLFAELREKFPGRHPNDDLLRNYLVRNGFAPAALTAVISAYRETSEMVERENEGHEGGSDQAGADLPMPQTNTSQASPTLVPPASVQLGQVVLTRPPEGSERSIGRYDFEGGQFVRISASVGLDTEEALDMVETLIELKRKEIQRANRRANSTPPATSADAANATDNL